MARFIGLQCKKCGKEFHVLHGPGKSESIAGVSEDALAKNEYQKNEKVFESLAEHGKVCDGEIIYKGLGFSD